jgi:hypothetical protein
MTALLYVPIVCFQQHDVPLQVLECSEPCGNAVVEGDLILIWTAPSLKFYILCFNVRSTRSR